MMRWLLVLVLVTALLVSVMTPEERERITRNWERWRRMTPEEREELRQRWQQMAPEERARGRHR